MKLIARKIETGSIVNCPHCGEAILVTEEHEGATPEHETKAGKTPHIRAYTKNMPRRGGRRYKRWSPVEDKQLVSLAQTGHGARSIAKVMKRTKRAVEIRASMLNMAIKNRKAYSRPDLKKRWSEQDTSRMQEMAKKGEKYSTIGKELGRTPKAIYERINWLAKKAGESSPSQPKPKFVLNVVKRGAWSKEEEQMLTGMWKNGYETKSIATRLRRSISSVRNKIYELQKMDTQIPIRIVRHKLKQEESVLDTLSQ